MKKISISPFRKKQLNKGAIKNPAGIEKRKSAIAFFKHISVLSFASLAYILSFLKTTISSKLYEFVTSSLILSTIFSTIVIFILLRNIERIEKIKYTREGKILQICAILAILFFIIGILFSIFLINGN